MRKKYRKIKAYTLIEVLIVMVLLAMLMFFSFFLISTQLKKARDARRKMDLHKIKNKLEVFYYSKKAYPEELPDCGEPLKLGKEEVISLMPCDPKSKVSYEYVVDSGSGAWFKIYTKLENLDDKIIDEIGCFGGCGPDCVYNYGVTSPNTSLDKCEGPPILYACSPGGGELGHCERYDDPELSLCPKVYSNDPTCNSECSIRDNRCKNSAGKHRPD